jgi:hypothetical protein
MKCKIQNANYFEMMKCKMPKISWMCLIHPKYQIFHGVGEGFFIFLAFFSLLRPKSKIKNGYLFAKNFA